jgi:hypothetical protein
VYVDAVPYTFTAIDGVFTVKDLGPGCHTLSTHPGGGAAHDERRCEKACREEVWPNDTGALPHLRRADLPRPR